VRAARKADRRGGSSRRLKHQPNSSRCRAEGAGDRWCRAPRTRRTGGAGGTVGPRDGAGSRRRDQRARRGRSTRRRAPTRDRSVSEPRAHSRVPRATDPRRRRRAIASSLSRGEREGAARVRSEEDEHGGVSAPRGSPASLVLRSRVEQSERRRPGRDSRERARPVRRLGSRAVRCTRRRRRSPRAPRGRDDAGPGGRVVSVARGLSIPEVVTTPAALSSPDGKLGVSQVDHQQLLDLGRGQPRLAIGRQPIGHEVDGLFELVHTARGATASRRCASRPIVPAAIANTAIAATKAKTIVTASTPGHAIGQGVARPPGPVGAGRHPDRRRQAATVPTA